MSVDAPDGDDDPYAGTDLLPDRERAPNPWLQILRDMCAPAPMSHWCSEVTTVRIRVYDQIRPFVNRAMLLAVIATLLWFAPGTWWLTYGLLIPAVIQVAFEIALDFHLNASDGAHIRVLEGLAAIAESAHAETLVNFTGLVGALAVPCNIVAVAYFSGPSQPSWPKVLALAAAAAYGVSGILSFLTDATHYSAHQSPRAPYRLFRAVRPHLWLVILLLMTGIVAGSVVDHRWSPEMVPLAWALCLFPVVIGMKQRDYERFLRASSERLPNVQEGAKKVLTKDYHNTNTDIRTFNREVAVDDSVPAGIRVRAAALAPLISLMSEAIDHEQWVRQQQRPSLAGIATKYGSDAALNLAVDIRLDDLESRNYELARALIAGLLANVGQAINKVKRELAQCHREMADDRVSVLGELRAGQVFICIRDPLPPISDWCREGSTTLWLHQDLIAQGSREGLTQHPVDPHNPNTGKEIRASWPVKKPPLKLREIRR